MIASIREQFCLLINRDICLMTETLLNNRYQILQILGRGGFGETFLAIDTHMPSARKCVIKQLKPAIQTAQIPAWMQERFQREAAILEELGENHPQIPRLYAYFSEAGDFYLVQEWIEGMTLTQKHQQKGNFSEEEVRDILIALLPILDYIHSRRIIHRDLKPDNIILRASDGKPVLIDFGVMKEAVATLVNPNGQTIYSVALGTPGYMSSEQAAGRPVYSSDLYSLGLTAVFLLTGKTPQYLTTDASTGEILWRQDLPNLHSNLATVIDRAIRFHPRDRFSSAQEMLATLQSDRERSQAATIAVAPQARLSQTYSNSKKQTHLPSGATPSAPSEPENVWMPWIFGLLLFAGVTAGAFAIGFYVFSLKSSSDSSPSPPFDSTPQTFPPIPSPEPQITPAPAPELEVTPSPQPEVTPTPEPEATISPSPEATPSEEPEATTSPAPEATPNEEAEATTSPVPEETPNEEAEATTSPVPEETPNEEAEATTSPSPETSPTPAPELSPSSPGITIQPLPPASELTPIPTPTTPPEEKPPLESGGIPLR